MTDQKKTLPFHITITHGEDILLDTDTDAIIASAHTEDGTEHGGTAVHLLTECNTNTLIGILAGANTAIASASDSIRNRIGDILFDRIIKDAIAKRK